MSEKEASGRAGSSTDGRGPTRLVIAGVGLLTIVCALIVAFVIAGNSDDTKHEIAGNVKLTKSEVRGRELFGETCSSCHTLKAANAAGRIGPNLDELHPDRALVLNAIDMGRSMGRGEMPGGLFSGREAEEVAAFVATATRRSGKD